jgi:hypothetical protein
MKYILRIKNTIPAILIILLFHISGCNDINELGMNLLPSSDLLNVKNALLKQKIHAYTHAETRIRTDEAEKSLLGSMNDSIFGNTTADFAAQFRISSLPVFNGQNPTVDSIALYLYYRTIYGDTLTKQRIKVYELKDQLYADTLNTKGGSGDYPYYQDINLKNMAYTKLLGQREFIPRVKLDTVYKDTVFQPLRISIDKSLGEKLIKAKTAEMANNDAFLNFFKGLYIESEKVTGKGGTIVSMDAPSDNNYQGLLILYYSNDSIKTKVTKDSLRKSLTVAYEITENSARVNRITHDYSNTRFIAKLNATSNPDSMLYLQSGGGLKSRIFINELSGWKDSANIAINKAEIIFQIDTVASQVKKYQPPTRLLFLYIDENNESKLPVDFSFNSAFYGGILNKKDWTYRFNITQHMQRIAAKNSDDFKANLGFELTPLYKNSEATRVVLKGSTSKTGIRMVITYTRFVQ